MNWIIAHKDGIFWSVWGLIGGIYETFAILDKTPGDTLSEQIWWLRDHEFHFSLFGFLLAGLFAWLTYHFTFEGR
jgi:hypothetical protein